MFVEEAAAFSIKLYVFNLKIYIHVRASVRWRVKLMTLVRKADAHAMFCEGLMGVAPRDHALRWWYAWAIERRDSRRRAAARRRSSLGAGGGGGEEGV